MAYDRYDRDERDRWSNDRSRERSGGGRGGRDERGFFERASEEISSWFGGNEDNEEQYRGERPREDRGMWNSARGGEQRGRQDYRGGRHGGYERDRDEHRPRGDQNRGLFADGGSSERDYNPEWRQELAGGGRHPEERNYGRERGYRPMAGDYGRAGHHERGRQSFAGDRQGGGYGRDDDHRSGYERSQSPWGRDEYRRTSYAGSSDHRDRSDPARGSHSGMGRSAERGRPNSDPHYDEWRDRHISDLDRDYHEYRREHQSRFESDFAGWREKRGQKRSMLGGVHEHMEVVGNDNRHVGTIDKVAGDRLILTKSDPQSGGRHHSISCHDIDRVEGDRVILDCSADQARGRWREEDHSRALFEREDQGQDGPHILDRSFEGTYRR